MLTWKNIEDFIKNGVSAPENKVIKTEEEWKKLLSDDVFFITRQSGTEHAFSSEMCSRFEPGIYACVCCGTLLFDASEKFDSQSGWPSFTQPFKESELIQYLKPDGSGPSGNTCPRCASQQLHVTSILVII